VGEADNAPDVVEVVGAVVFGHVLRCVVSLKFSCLMWYARHHIPSMPPLKCR